MTTTNLIAQFNSQFPLFLVVLVRVAGILAAVPAIGSHAVPPQVRVMLVLGLTLILLPVVGDRVGMSVVSLPQILSLVLTEFLIGLVLGLCLRFVFVAFEMAGELVGIQMGLNLISALDPAAGMQVPLLGRFMGLLSVLIFFAIDGHHLVMEALVSSFQLLPPLHAHLNGAVVDVVLKLAAGMFILALKVGAPAMTALFVATFAMGILGRSIPQLNVMLNTVPVTVGVGLLVLGFSLPLLGALAQISLTELGPTLRGVLTLMGQGK